MTIKLLCIDDHRMISEWVSDRCDDDPDFEFLGGYVALEGVPIPSRTSADIVILDLMLERDLDKWDVLDEVLTWGPKVIVMSALDEGRIVDEALGRGAVAYVGKRVHRLEFASLLRLVDGGAVGTVIAADPPEDLPLGVTPALRRLLVGLTHTTDTAELAAQLHLSERTVEVYIGRLYDTLMTTPRNRARLSDQARALGL